MSQELQAVEQPTRLIIPGMPGPREIQAMADHCREVMPDWEEFSNSQVIQCASFALTHNLDPQFGEMWAWLDKDGKLVMMAGYRVWTRWAHDEAPYISWTEPNQVGDGNIGYRCFVLLREDQDFVRFLTKSGMDVDKAMKRCAFTATGMISKNEMAKKKWPPTGWTWNSIAEKRALVNTLKQSHGQPDPLKLRAQRLSVGNIQTQNEDWPSLTEGLSPSVREATAVLNAQERMRRANPDKQSAPEAMAELFGDDDNTLEGVVVAKEPVNEPEPHWSEVSGTALTQFWVQVRSEYNLSQEDVFVCLTDSPNGDLSSVELGIEEATQKCFQWAMAHERILSDE